MSVQDRSTRPAISAIATLLLMAAPAGAQQVANPAFQSVGRGAPLVVADLRKYDLVGPTLSLPFGQQAPPGTTEKTLYYAARDGAAPAGVKPLPVDLFTIEGLLQGPARCGPTRAISAATARSRIEEQRGANGAALDRRDAAAQGAAWGYLRSRLSA